MPIHIGQVIQVARVRSRAVGSSSDVSDPGEPRQARNFTKGAERQASKASMPTELEILDCLSRLIVGEPNQQYIAVGEGIADLQEIAKAAGAALDHAREPSHARAEVSGGASIAEGTESECFAPG